MSISDALYYVACEVSRDMVLGRLDPSQNAALAFWFWTNLGPALDALGF